jgi:hypothetical protein
MAMRRFVRVGPRGRFPPWGRHMGDVVIDELIQRHDTADGALRDIGPCQQTPDAEPAGIRMRFLQVVHLRVHPD